MPKADFASKGVLTKRKVERKKHLTAWTASMLTDNECQPLDRRAGGAQENFSFNENREKIKNGLKED